jgi:hypothetical protein
VEGDEKGCYWVSLTGAVGGKGMGVTEGLVRIVETKFK